MRKIFASTANDVIRLSQLLAPESHFPIAERIAGDLNRFLDGITADRFARSQIPSSSTTLSPRSCNVSAQA